MITQNIALNKIKDGMKLNAYEAGVWTSLLSRGISSAGELAEMSGVPRSRCYDVLESLEKKGFVFMKIGKPIKYMAVSPEEVLNTLKKQTRIEEKRLLALFDSAKKSETFNELQTLYSTGISYIDIATISHSITGRQNINLFLKDMLSRASKNVIIHTTKKGVKRKLKVLKKSLNDKVKVTINAPAEKAIPSGNIKFNKIDTCMRLVHIDNDELLFFTSPEEADPSLESAVWIKSKFAIDALKSFLR